MSAVLPPNEAPGPNQAFFAQKSASTVRGVTFTVISTLMAAQALKSDQFVEQYVNPRLSELGNVDDRTYVFFHNMMDAINKTVDSFPGMKGIFDQLAVATKDPMIRDKFVGGLAIGPVKQLMVELDDFNRSIIDDIVRSSPPEYLPPAKSKEAVEKEMAAAINEAATALFHGLTK